MDPALRDRLKELFSHALDLDEPARSAYIDQACQSDSALREAVGDMLEGRGPAQGFLASQTVPGGLAPVFLEGQLVADRFRVERFHGRGGMGEVYEAFDERLRLKLGLKTIRSDWAPDQEARERFQREILVAREVAHPNLCRVYDLIEHREPGAEVTSCLTMEWLEGETLQAELRRRRPLPLDEARRILTQVAAALDALHGAGIMHRDLKPGNIMLVPLPGGATRVVVMDFGLAKPVAGLSRGDLYESTADAQAGAPYFMAPEQLRSEKPTTASDIYAFGLVMDEMVTESRAFDAGSLGAIYFQRLWEAPIAPGRRAPGLPAAWETAILRCLEKEARHRPASASEALSPLLEASRTVPVPSTRWRKRWPVGAAAASLVAVGLAVPMQPPALDTSMVVFPIRDLTGDTSFRHIPGGLTGELVSRLSQLQGLSVKQYYLPREKAPVDSIRERFHLDGDLQKYEKRVRLTLRMTDADNSDRVVWSDTIDRDMANPLDLQADVARRVTHGIEQRLLADASTGKRAQYAGARLTRTVREAFGFARPTAPATENPVAYHLYLRGQQLLGERRPESVDQAIQVLESCLREDPKFVRAYAALSEAYVARLDGQRGDSAELLRVAKRYAEEAVRLNPESPEAQTALASVRQNLWDWEGAEVAYREAIRLAPRSPVAYRKFGGLLMQFGRFDEGLALVKKGIEIDPYDYPAQSAYGLCLALARRNSDAEAQFLYTIRQSNLMLAHNNLGSLYVAMAREARGEERERYIQLALKEAAIFEEMERSGRPEGAATPVSDYMFGLAYAVQGDAVAARRRIDHLRTVGQGDRLAPAALALIHAALGEKETALRYLVEAARLRDRRLLYLKVLSHWDSLRDTKEYRGIVNSMRL